MTEAGRFKSGGIVLGPMGIHPEGEEVIAPLDDLKRFLNETTPVAHIQGVNREELIAAFQEIDKELKKDWNVKDLRPGGIV